MLRYLTKRRFSMVDVVWLTWFTLAWNDGFRVTAIAFALGAAFLSGALEGWANRRRAKRHAGAAP